MSILTNALLAIFILQDIFLVAVKVKSVVSAITLLGRGQTKQTCDFNCFSNKSNTEQTRGNKWSQCYLPESFMPRQKFHSLAVGGGEMQP